MGEAAAKEPSMEDILSSIRKIISDEGNNQATNPVETAAEPAVPPAPYTPPAVESVEPAPVQEAAPSEPVAPPSLSEIARAAVANNSEPATISAEINVEPAACTPAPAPVEEPVAATASLEDIKQSLVSEATPPATGANSLADIAARVSKNEAVHASQPASPAPQAQPQQPSPEPVVASAEAPKAEPTAAPVAAAAEISQPQPAQLTAEQRAEEAAFKGALVSPSTDSAVNDSFERLKRSAMDDIDAKTEAILRPMLREWLDNNLPSMVERLVREEIERVSRGI